MDIRKTKIPTIKNVKACDNLTVIVTFEDSTVKAFSLKPYVEKFDFFKPLLEQKFFRKVKAKKYMIYWNDCIDVSIYDIWEDGTTMLAS